MPKAGYFGAALAQTRVLGTYEEEVLFDGPDVYFPLGELAGSAPVDQMGRVVPDSYAGMTFGQAGVGDRATAPNMAGTNGVSGLRMPDASFPVPSSTTGATYEVLAVASTYTAADELLRWNGVFDLRVGVETMQAYWGGITSGFTVGASYTIPDPYAIHHWAITWDGTTARLYDNGTQVRTAARPAPTPVATGVGVGCDPNPAVTNRNWAGRLGGFAAYSKVLSPSRLTFHARAAGVIV